MGHFRKLTIAKKLFLYFILTSTIPLLAIGWMSYRTSRAALREEAQASTIELLVEKRKALDLLMDTAESLIANISGLEDIKDVLQRRFINEYDKLSTHAKIGYILCRIRERQRSCINRSFLNDPRALPCWRDP